MKIFPIIFYIYFFWYLLLSGNDGGVSSELGISLFYDEHEISLSILYILTYDRIFFGYA